MNAKRAVMRWANWFISKHFRLTQFTALLGVHQAHGLPELLERDDSEQPYAGVYGLHGLRWILFDPNEPNGVASIAAPQSQALVLSLVCDGNVDDVLAQVLEQAGPRVRDILSRCRGFDVNAEADVISYLRRYEIPCNFLFRDLGPLVLPPPAPAPPPGVLSTLQRVRRDSGRALRVLFAQEPDLEPDPTRAEIDDAFDMQRRFFAFYGEHFRDERLSLRQHFLKELGQHGFPLPLTRFERRAENEASWTRRMIDTGIKLQDRTARQQADGTIRRAAHAKGHGLIHAQLRVLGTGEGRPKELLAGLFARENSFEVVLRPSNGAGKPKADRARDARGLAMRVHVPWQTRVGDADEPTFFQQPDEQPWGCQDFVLMSEPAFFAPGIADLVRWFRISELPKGKLPVMLAMLAVPGGLRQSLLLQRTALRRVRHPFQTSYHSATSFLYGEDERYIAKYSVEADDPRRFRQLAQQKDPDSLQLALKNILSDGGGPVVLRFHVHLLAADARLPRNLTLADLVEDATIDWSKHALKVHVANLEIGEQDPTTAERLRLAEEHHFNPWHCLKAHRPLGSLNRARWAAYPASQAHRTPAAAAVHLAEAAE